MRWSLFRDLLFIGHAFVKKLLVVLGIAIFAPRVIFFRCCVVILRVWGIILVVEVIGRLVRILLSDWLVLWIRDVVVLVSVVRDVFVVFPAFLCVFITWWWGLSYVWLWFILDGDTGAPLEMESISSSCCAVFGHCHLFYPLDDALWHGELVPLLPR